MSNLDVQVLKSFTHKLAAAAKLAGRRPFIDDPPAKPLTPNIDRKLNAPGLPASAAPARLPPPPSDPAFKLEPDSNSRSFDYSTPAGADPVTTNSTLEADTNGADFNAPGTPASADVTMSANPNAAPDLSGGGPDSNYYYDALMGALPYAGGAAAGGLGAMALARLFNSSKDDEEEGSWAPWLAGLGGAAAGAGAVHYSPQIMEMINALRGGDTAPAAVSAPAPKA
jgi:hypothetical protein